MECHRINGKIWVIQISYFIQIQDHQSTIGNTSCPWKVLDPSKLATVLGSLPIWPFERAWLYDSYHLHSPTCATVSRGSFFAQEVEPGGGSRNHSADGRSTRSNFGPKLGAFLRHWTLGVGRVDGAPFFFGSPNQKMGGFFLGDNPKGWRSKWNGDFKGKVLSSHATTTSSRHLFQADSNGQEVRRWKRLPLKSYKYVHESWSSIWKIHKIWEKQK